MMWKWFRRLRLSAQYGAPLSAKPQAATAKLVHHSRWVRYSTPIGLAFALIASLNFASAQEPDSIRKIVVPSLDPQVAARFEVFEQRLNPVHSPGLAVGTIGKVIVGGHLQSLSAIVADAQNQEVWEQSPDQFVGLVHESGGALITWPTNAPRFGQAWSSAQVRRLCQEKLALLPRAALQTYRERVEAEVKALLEQGRRTHETGPLRKIVEEHYASGYADRALDLLGDLAFERGDFAEATHWWRLLVGEAVVPAPSANVELARIRAKRALALMFAGRFDDAHQAIREFHRVHPRAKGMLAGRDDFYHATLQSVLAGLAEARIVNNDAAWTTFGGDGARNRVLSQSIHWQLWEDGPAWRVALPSLQSADQAKAGGEDRSSPNRLLAFHPVVAGDQVFLADHRSIIGYHLFTGKETLRFELGLAGLADPGSGVGTKAVAPRFTLSTDGQRLFARLGSIRIGSRKDAAKPSYVVCLDITDPGTRKNRLLWHLKSQADDKSETVFEGTPLVHDGRVFVAVSRIANRQTMTSISCYDTAGQQRWTREVCETPEFEESADQPRYRQHLLTLAAGQVVYCSHSGAIVAVDAATGSPTWAVRYPSRGPTLPNAELSPRDLAPCVYADGLIVSAPLDSDRVFGIDVWTGRVRWELEGVEATQILGIARGRVFITTRAGVVAVDGASGQIVWQQPTEGRLPGLGRAVVSGGWLIWSTQDAKLPYRALSLATGEQEKRDEETSVLPEPQRFDPTLFHSLPMGNWAMGQGCLVIAGTHELSVFLPPDKQIKPAPALDPRPQARLLKQYHDARVEAQSGDAQAAYAKFALALPNNRAGKAWRELVAVRTKNLAIADMPAPQRIVSRPERLVQQPRADKPAKRIDAPNLPVVQAWPPITGLLCPLAYDDANSDRFFVQSAGEFLCYSASDGKPRWRTPRDAEPRWLGRWRDYAVLVGDDVIEARSLADGSLAWTYRLREVARSFATVVAGQPIVHRVSTGVSHIEVVDDTLFFVDDSRHFFRLQLKTGKVYWRYAPSGVNHRPLNASAYPSMMRNVDVRVLLQNLDGQPMILANHDTTPIGQASRPWTQPPVLIGNLAVFAGEAGTVHAYDIGKVAAHAWTWTPEWATSLTGEPCRLIHEANVLLALVARNDGVEWVRLDPATGGAIWAGDAKPARGLSDIGAVTIDGGRFFHIADNKLFKRSLEHGKIDWEQPLLAGAKNGAICATKNYLIVFPPNGNHKAGFSVEFLDSATGERLQRLAFPHAAGPCRLALAADRILISDGTVIHTFRSLALE